MDRTARAEVVIEAPSDFVFGVLEDFERYPEWNPFTHRVVLHGRTHGSRVELHVRMDGFARVMNEELRVYEPPRRMAWGLSTPAKVAPGALIEATRYQEVIELGGDRSRYATFERFDGALGSLVMALFGKRVEAGFQATADALKARAEALYGTARVARP
jgi:hypothetical protein